MITEKMRGISKDTPVSQGTNALLETGTCIVSMDDNSPEPESYCPRRAQSSYYSDEFSVHLTLDSFILYSIFRHPVFELLLSRHVIFLPMFQAPCDFLFDYRNSNTNEVLCGINPYVGGLCYLHCFSHIHWDELFRQLGSFPMARSFVTNDLVVKLYTTGQMNNVQIVELDNYFHVEPMSRYAPSSCAFSYFHTTSATKKPIGYNPPYLFLLSFFFGLGSFLLFFIRLAEEYGPVIDMDGYCYMKLFKENIGPYPPLWRLRYLTPKQSGSRFTITCKNNVVHIENSMFGLSDIDARDQLLSYIIKNGNDTIALRDSTLVGGLLPVVSDWFVYLVFVSVVMVFLQEPFSPKCKIFTFGSKGDKTPLIYYASFLQSLGYLTTIIHTVNEPDGKNLLESVEKQDFCYPIWQTISALWQIHTADHADCIILSPFKASAFGSCVVYNVTPSKKLIKGFKLLTGKFGDMLNWIVDLFVSYEVDIPIGCEAGFAPRSADGKTPLRGKPNIGSRDTLITLGSSSISEPEGLDVTTTWSTSPTSRYLYEDRTDHENIFAEYKHVICHGGAGTVATAKSCGCKVTTTSDLLDRDYRTDAEFDFTGSPSIFVIKLIKAIPYEKKLGHIINCWSYLNNRERLDLTSHWVHKSVIRCFILYLVIVRWLVNCVLNWVQGNDLTVHIIRSLNIPLVSGTFSVVIAIAIWEIIALRGPLHFMRWLYSLRRFARRWINLQLNNYFALVDQRCYILTGLFGCLARLSAWDTLSHICVDSDLLTPKILNLLDPDWGIDNIDITADNIVIAFQKFESKSTLLRDIISWIPLYHAEFRHYPTNIAFGATCTNDRMCQSYTAPITQGKHEFFVKTSLKGCSIPSIIAKLQARDGSSYGPINHCQLRISQLCSELDLNLNVTLLLVLVSVLSSIAMSILGPTLLLFGLVVTTFGGKAETIYPIVAFAALEQEDPGWTWKTVCKLLGSVSMNFAGFNPIHTCDDYPVVDINWMPLNASSLHMMSVSIGPLERKFFPPLAGVYRPEYTTGRVSNRQHIHNLDPDSLIKGKYDGLIREFRRQLLAMKGSLKGKVGLVALTGDRVFQKRTLDWIESNLDSFVLITDQDGPGKRIILDEPGRVLACLRLAAPVISGVRWVSLNAEYDDLAFSGLTKLAQTLNYNDNKGSWYVSAHALMPSAAGLMTYEQPLIKYGCVDLSVYGAEEFESLSTPMVGFIAIHKYMFSFLSHDGVDDCEREYRFYEPNRPTVELVINSTKFSSKDIIPRLREAKLGTASTLVSDDGYIIHNDATIDAIDLTEALYGPHGNIGMIAEDIMHSAKSFIFKVENIAVESIKASGNNPMAESMLLCYNSVLKNMSPDGRAAKKIWAPVHKELQINKVAEIGIDIHPNPVFVNADYDSTLTHYVRHLNRFLNSTKSKSKPQLLKPTEFRRRVNRSPHVDLWLKGKLSDGVVKGVDASTIACKEVMLASLSRYHKNGLVDAMTDKDIHEITESIYLQNKDLLSDAMVADPGKLTKKFLSFKQYSAGMPFIYEGSGVKKRCDLRRGGWLRPIMELGKLPYTSGKWYPAISHSFPKSQVVNWEKIMKNPGKMRSIVATSGFNNVEQGILNYEINNRHDFMGTNEKVAMPLSGRYMSYIFEDLATYNHCYSLDATAMDANLCDGVLKVIAELRKKGFENHPAYEALCKHIDCAMEQTKHAHIVNLISDDVNDVFTDDATLDDRVREWAVGAKLPPHDNHASAPGGVLHKTSGGSTGDSNVTFNNTKGLTIIMMYSICKAAGIPYADFFKKVSLHNFGDDDVIGTNYGKTVMDKAIEIARDDLNVEMRYEANGNNVYDQVFLGRKPIPVNLVQDDFDRANIKAPKYAIINDVDVLRMRFVNEKTDATRHKGRRHELYRLEKCMGYMLLSAHNESFYNDVVSYFREVTSRLPDDVQNAKWFKKKFKIISYTDVLKKWYKPISVEHFQGVHGLQIRIGIIEQCEATLLRLFRMVGKIADDIPINQLELEGAVTPYRGTNSTTGIFEAHAWHTFVKEFSRRPTDAELLERVNIGPFAQFTNVPLWNRTKGAVLPMTGLTYERNMSMTTNKLMIFTTMYLSTNKVIELARLVPGGNILTSALNLWLFKSRKYFGSLSYLHYIGTGTGNHNIDALAPKDPYAFHKRIACNLVNMMPNVPLLGSIPTNYLFDWMRPVTEEISKVVNLNPSTNSDLHNSPTYIPWLEAIVKAFDIIDHGSIPLIVAHTGTGKTRYVPSLLDTFPRRRGKKTVVVMPRNIICEEWVKSSGALWKKRGVSDSGNLMTCTYGYLAHCFANSMIWWDLDTIFIFDEAHEESIEWKYLRENFISTHICMALTATPHCITCTDFELVQVAIEPKFSIDEVFELSDLNDAVSKYASKANRFLIIEPSLKKCRAISAKLTATGYPNKVVHSGDRSIPPDIHIVATSVIEASITIPNCDLVIDTGMRLVNDGGNLRRIPNTRAGYIQRRGRTGRTNSGLCICLNRPVDREIPPIPDVTALVCNHPIAAVSDLAKQLSKNFLPAPTNCQLAGDRYAHIQKGTVTNDELPSISLVHLLRISGLEVSQMREVYNNITIVKKETEYDHIVDTIKNSRNTWMKFHEALTKYYTLKIRYIGSDGVVLGNVLLINNSKLECFRNDFDGTVNSSTGETSSDRDRAQPRRNRKKGVVRKT